MQAYSLDIRERVMKVYDEGKHTVRQIARRFEVGEWWIHKLKRQRQQQGSLAVRVGKVGKPRSYGAKELSRLVQYVEKYPDASLEQIHQKLGLGGTTVTIHNTLRRLGYSYKKNATGQRTRSR